MILDNIIPVASVIFQGRDCSEKECFKQGLRIINAYP